MARSTSAALAEKPTCVDCNLPVIAVERLMVGKQLYHTGCYKIKSVDEDDSLPPSKITKADEDAQVVPNSSKQKSKITAEFVRSVLEKSLSDEEKATGLLYEDSRSLHPPNEDVSLMYHTAMSTLGVSRANFMQELIQPHLDDLNEEVKGLNNHKDLNDVQQVKDDFSEYDSDSLPPTDSLKLSVGVNISDSDALKELKGSEQFRDVSGTKDDLQKDDEQKKQTLKRELKFGLDTSVIVISDDSQEPQAYITISDDSRADIGDNSGGFSGSIVEVDEDDDQEEAEVPQVKSDADTTNPFGDDDEEEIEVPSSNLSLETKKSLNPFSDDEDSDEGKQVIKPLKKIVLRPTNQVTESPLRTQKSKTLNLKDYSGKNPFSSDEDESAKEPAKPLKKIHPRQSDYQLTTGSTGDTPENCKTLLYKRESLPPSYKTHNSLDYSGKNPFSSDEDDDFQEKTTTQQNLTEIERKPLKKIHPRPSDYKLTTGSTGNTPENCKTLMYKRESMPANFERKTPPKLTLNPFSSDEDEDQQDESLSTTHGSMSSVNQQTREGFGSTTSLTSTASSSKNSYRKKKPAPKPPILLINPESSPHASITSSPSTSANHSPKPRKSKRAPLPPCNSTPLNAKYQSTASPGLFHSPSPIKKDTSHENTNENSASVFENYEKQKVAKDEANRQTQSGMGQLNEQTTQIGQTSGPDSAEFSLPSNYKTSYSKWKKKGQAPGLPVAQKRTVKALPMTEIKKELDIIEVQLQGLNKQGNCFKKIIREKCEGPDADQDATEIPAEVEDLMEQLFEVVNEKNQLCRRQAELMYLKRQHRLEEEQADIEYQVRCLMLQSSKSDSEKLRETQLVERLVEIVNLRAEIVECLEMDRVRGVEEDDSIQYSMSIYSNSRKQAAAAASSPSSTDASPKKDKKKKFRKLLKFKKLTASKIDADKDVDESETALKAKKSDKSKSGKKNK